MSVIARSDRRSGQVVAADVRHGQAISAGHQHAAVGTARREIYLHQDHAGAAWHHGESGVRQLLFHLVHPVNDDEYQTCGSGHRGHHRSHFADHLAGSLNEGLMLGNTNQKGLGLAAHFSFASVFHAATMRRPACNRTPSQLHRTELP